MHKHHNIKKGTRWVPFDKPPEEAPDGLRRLGAPTGAMRSCRADQHWAASKHGPESGCTVTYASACVRDLKEMTQKNVQTGFARDVF